MSIQWLGPYKTNSESKLKQFYSILHNLCLNLKTLYLRYMQVPWRAVITLSTGRSGEKKSKNYSMVIMINKGARIIINFSQYVLLIVSVWCIRCSFNGFGKVPSSYRWLCTLKSLCQNNINGHSYKISVNKNLII